MTPPRNSLAGQERPGLLDAQDWIRDLSTRPADPGSDLILPKGSTNGDWEVELGIDGLGEQRQELFARARQVGG